MMSSRLDLSVVIVSFNDIPALTGCLASLYQNTSQAPFEVIIVNNAVRELSWELKKRFPGITWIENNKNLGFSKAINQGLRAARAEYILSINSDTIIGKNSILPLTRFLNENPRAGAVAGMVLDKKGEIQPTCRRFPTYLNAIFNRTSLLTKIFPKNRFSARYLLSRWDHCNTRRVNWACGAYLMFRKKALEDVGLMDEKFFLYCEDADWCRRAKLKGWKIYYLPEAAAIHLQNNHAYACLKFFQHRLSMLKFYQKLHK